MEKLTEKELKLLKYVLVSNFNSDEIKLDRPWNEQRFEGDDFTSFVELADYNIVLGTNNAGSRGVLGALVKKNLVGVTPDDSDGQKVYWLTINEEQFNNIKEVM